MKIFFGRLISTDDRTSLMEMVEVEIEEAIDKDKGNLTLEMSMNARLLKKNKI